MPVLSEKLRTAFTAACFLLLVGGTASAAPSEGWRKKREANGVAIAINPLNPNTIYASVNSFNPVVAVSYDRGQTWTSQFNPGLSDVRQILIHPLDSMTIFCAGVSNLRKSTDGGVTWKTVLPGYTIDGESIVIDPLHPDSMHAAESTEGKIYHSTDRGEHWLDSSLSVNNISTLSIRPDNPVILYAGTGLGSISKSVDAGKTWRVVKHPSSPGVLKTEAIAISPASPLIAYAAFNGSIDTSVGIWKTTNGGEKWVKTNSAGLSVQGLDVDPVDPNIAYAGSAASGAGTIYRTTDGGDSWTPMHIGLPSRGGVQVIKIHPVDPSVKWAAVSDFTSGGGGVHRFGITSTVISGAVLNAVTSDTVKNGFVVTTPIRDSVNLSTSGGTFSFYYFDGDPTLTIDVSTQAYPYYHSTRQLTFAQDQETIQDLPIDELARRSISGTVFDSATGSPRRAELRLRGMTSLGALDIIDSSAADGTFSFDSLYITYSPISRYIDVVVGPDLPYGRQRLQSIVLDTNGSHIAIPLTTADVLVVGASDSAVYANYYATALESLHVAFNMWDEKTRGTAPMSIAASLRKRTIVYYTGSQHTPLPQADIDSLISALDAGCSLFLTGQDIAEKNDTTRLLKDYLHTGYQSSTLIAYVSGIAGDIYHLLGFNTVNFGASNQTSRDILKPLDPLARTVIGYGYGNLGSAAVRLDSVGGGGKAILMGFGFEAISGEEVRYSIMQRTLGYFDGSIIADVGNQRSQGEKPAGFSLAQNYPNPFNPSTTISFDIAEPADVILAVFDLNGKEIATLFRGRKESGSYTASWDAARFSSGVYFCRLIASPFGRPGATHIETKSMIFMK